MHKAVVHNKVMLFSFMTTFTKNAALISRRHFYFWNLSAKEF